ncbi:hypothetical protein HN587_07090 [Candidatus Woesearchaeota archaeon]|jgi:hypothetical protein|nr:hypothetical protein [Candidatus Woesearchaeota archaeon]
MKSRQVVKALDQNNNSIHVDSIPPESKEFYCPFCKKEVIPRRGEKVVWHFAHKDEVCEFLNLKSKDDLDNATIELEKTISINDLEFKPISKYFMCVKCKNKFNKEVGIKWDSSEFICKDCFKLS